jgi:hypothetical protein
VRELLEKWGVDLPPVSGACAVVALVGAQARVWEVAWRQPGPSAASHAGASEVASALAGHVGRAGLVLLFEPSVVLGELSWSGPFEQLQLPGGAGFAFRQRGPEREDPVAAVGSLDAARELTERSVLQLGEGLDEVFRLAELQCTEMKQVVRQFDASGGLGDAVSALEREVGTVGSALRDSLSSHTTDVGVAAASAKDIARLALAVSNIAESARMLTFNARVESARLGEAGKGFIVIANAIRELANDVQSSNALVTNLATKLVSSLPLLQRDTQELANRTDKQLDAVRERLGSLRESFQGTRDQALVELRTTETAASSLRDRAHDVIQHLQFHDRAGQLLLRVKSQVEAMEEALGIEESAEERIIERVGQLGRRAAKADIALQPGGVALF